jgi:beta-lactamase regulating signal transducer with metallopeptidase domain
MNEIFLKILELSVLGSILIVVVVAVRLMTYHKVKKSVFYLLWMIVFIKLICPVEFDVPMKVDFSKYEAIFGGSTDEIDAVHNDNFINISSDVDNMENPSINEVMQNSVNQEKGETDNPIQVELNGELKAENQVELTQVRLSWLELLTKVWMIGVFVLIGIFVIVYIKGRSKLNLVLIEKDDGVNHLIDDSSIKLYRGNVAGPLVIGFFLPKIVLPYYIRLDDEFMKYVLIHERQHIKFFDNAINVLFLFITVIHWFNPIIWMGYYYFKQDLESFCDERVIASIGEEHKTNYAEAIVEFIGFERKFGSSYMLAFGEKNTKKRIKGVLTYKSWKVSSILVAMVIIGVVILGFMIQSGANSLGEEAVENLEGINSQMAQLKPIVLENDQYTIYGTSISDGLIIITNGKDSDERRYGFANVEGEIVIEPIYLSTLVGFSEGLAYVMNEERQGIYIDTKGNVVIDEIDGKTFLIGDIFMDGYAIVRDSYDLNDPSYVINQKGEIILDPTNMNYQYINLGNGYFQRAISAITDDMIDIVDMDGNVVYEGHIDFYGIGDQAICLYTLDGEVFGLIDTNTMEIIVEPYFYPLSQLINDQAVVMTPDENIYIINSRGEKVVNLSKQYTDIEPSSVSAMGIGRYSLGFSTGKGAIIIDDTGNIVAETEYDYIVRFENDDSMIALCEKDGKYGYVDLEGNEILEPIYNRITNVEEGKGIVFLENKPYVLILNIS